MAALAEPSDPAASGHPAREARPGAPGQANARRRRSRRADWNVLAGELLAFPPSHRDYLRLGDPPRTDEPHAAEGPPIGACASDYGRRWLERELEELQSQADAAFSVTSPRRVRVPVANKGSAPAAQVAHRAGRAVVSRLDVRAAARPAQVVVAVPAPSDHSDAGISGSRALRLWRDAGLPDLDPRMAPKSATRTVPIRPRGLRRLLPGAATLALLGALWLGVGTLSGAEQPRIEVIPGSVPSHGGYVYLARPGDTLWSIASRLQPGGDPRPVVDQLEAQLHGSTLASGDRLLLP